MIKKNQQLYAALCLFGFLPLLAFVLSCSSSQDKYGVVELFHGKPTIPRMIPRQVLGDMPSGQYESQKITGIMIIDSGADYQGETSLTYMINLLRRYRTDKGLGEVPFHYCIDAEGVLYKGREDIIPAEMHEEDPFLFRSGEISQKDLLIKRLSRMTQPLIGLNEYIVIMVLGDYDQRLVVEAQEKTLFQLVSFLCFQHYIPKERIVTLQSIHPEIKNPGFYLNNYLSPAILEKNIPAIPSRPHFLRVPGKEG